MDIGFDSSLLRAIRLDGGDVMKREFVRWIARGHNPANIKLVNLQLDGILKRKWVPKKKPYISAGE